MPGSILTGRRATPPLHDVCWWQEWITPQPSRRPDIFPEFEKLTAPLPKPMPGDPEQPDSEEEEEEQKKPKEDPDKEKDPDEPEKEGPKPDKPD